ncbi:MAG: hypothetical protein R2780_10895 [Crocinitomicaceae bacterium]
MRLILSLIFLSNAFLSFTQEITAVKQLITGSDIHISQLKTDRDNNYYVAGYFSGTVNFNPSGNATEAQANESRDIFIAKYNIQHQLIWMNQIKQRNKFANTWSFLDVDHEGNVIVGGSFEKGIFFEKDSTQQLTTFGREDIYLLKMDHKGRTLWWRHIGGLHMDIASCVKTDSHGDIVICGQFSGPMDFDPGASKHVQTSSTKNSFIAKYSKDGDFSWVKHIKEEHNEGSTPPQICIDQEDNIILAGQFNGNAIFNDLGAKADSGSANIFVVKYDTYGKSIWQTKLDIDGFSPYSMVKSVIVSDDKILLTGWLNQCHLNNAELGGISANLFISSCDQNGKESWSRVINSSYNNFGSDICITDKDQIFIAGGFEGVLNLYTGEEFISNGTDALILQYSTAGNLVQCFQIGGFGEQYLESIDIRQDGKILAIGSFNRQTIVTSKSKPVYFDLTAYTNFPVVAIIN